MRVSLCRGGSLCRRLGLQRVKMRIGRLMKTVRGKISLRMLLSLGLALRTGLEMEKRARAFRLLTVPGKGGMGMGMCSLGHTPQPIRRP